MKIAYIAHPVGGDVKANLEKIRLIARQINLEEPETVPFAPYWLDCHALNDDNIEERTRGLKNDQELINRLFIDEVRLYGDRVSAGMAFEIELALQCGIPVIAMTDATREGLKSWQ